MICSIIKFLTFYTADVQDYGKEQQNQSNKRDPHIGPPQTSIIRFVLPIYTFRSAPLLQTIKA